MNIILQYYVEPNSVQYYSIVVCKNVKFECLSVSRKEDSVLDPIIFM
jgi:hypothetical protein